MFEPVPVGDRQDRDDRDGEEDAGHARQLVPGEDGEDDGERVQVDARADDARVDEVVVREAQDAEEGEHGEDLAHRVEARDDAGQHRDDERAEQGDELEDPGHDAEHEGVAHVQDDKGGADLRGGRR